MGVPQGSIIEPTLVNLLLHNVFDRSEVLGKINSLLKHPLSLTKVGLIMQKLGFENMLSGTGQRGYRIYEYGFDEIKVNQFGDSAQSG